MSKRRIIEQYGDPKLWYEPHPPKSELRCMNCADECDGPFVPKCQRVPGIAYKNGRPYNCNCNLKQAPYSYPFASSKNCQVPRKRW